MPPAARVGRRVMWETKLKILEYADIGVGFVVGFQFVFALIVTVTVII